MKMKIKLNTNLIWKRSISQHLTIHAMKLKSPINFHVDLLKVPSNFGYYTSRVNRMYNEDRWQTSILDLKPDELINKKSTLNNDKLIEETNRVKEPKYTANSPPIDRTIFAFGVFDGHGGDECSSYLKNHLYENIENLCINEDTILKLKDFYKLKISGYWKRWGRRIGDVMVSECKIENKVKLFIDEVNEKHGIVKKVDNTVDEIDHDHDHDHDDDNENEMDEKFIEWDDFSNGKKLWLVLNMMINEKKLTHWEIFKIRIWLGYLFTDYQFLTFENAQNELRLSKNKSKDIEDIKRKIIHSGSTCTSFFTYPLKWKNDNNNRYFYQDNVLSRLVVAHVGDTRAIICDKDGLAHSLTKDHHPSNPIESSRLRKLSAGLIMTDSFGEERFLNFANTRSFGDISAKNVGITSEPEISEYLIGNSTMIEEFKNDEDNFEIINNNEIKDFGGDEGFIVLISDGITNNLSDQEIVDLIMMNFNNKGNNKGNPMNGSREVVEFVQCINGDDNATCLVIRLNGWGKWPINDRTGKLREERMMDAGYKSFDR